MEVVIYPCPGVEAAFSQSCVPRDQGSYLRGPPCLQFQVLRPMITAKTAFTSLLDSKGFWEEVRFPQVCFPLARHNTDVSGVGNGFSHIDQIFAVGFAS